MPEPLKKYGATLSTTRELLVYEIQTTGETEIETTDETTSV